MRAEQVLDTVKRFFEVKRPVCIEGPPGGGKTSLAQQAAAQLGVEYIHKHMPTMLVEDFGILYPTKDSQKLEYKLPEWFPTDPDIQAILCFDDRNQCGADLQKVLANIQNQRELHGHRLPDGVMIVSTGNRQKDRAGANRVLSHLRDRETTLELETMLDDWCKWAIDMGVNPSVISFLRFRPGLLHDFDPQREGNSTPRGWVEGVSDIMDIVTPEIEYECFKGAVGEGAAAEFVGFRKIERSLPNIDNLLLNPDSGEVPTDPATLYALSGGIAHRASEANFTRVVTYCNRMPQEFGVLTISYAARKNRALSTTQAFTNWAVANQDVLF
tara:strand:+ start:424 stop:1407 length:984 start_codon:yes stop_codon:yes gene_type:complete